MSGEIGTKCLLSTFRSVSSDGGLPANFLQFFPHKRLVAGYWVSEGRYHIAFSKPVNSSDEIFPGWMNLQEIQDELGLDLSIINSEVEASNYSKFYAIPDVPEYIAAQFWQPGGFGRLLDFKRANPDLSVAEETLSKFIETFYLMVAKRRGILSDFEVGSNADVGTWFLFPELRDP